MASPDRYWSGRSVESALCLSCSATVLPALILNRRIYNIDIVFDLTNLNYILSYFVYWLYL